MPGFNAADAVEQLNYNFKPFVDVEGVVPEPSSDQINDYRKAIAQMFREMVPDDIEESAATVEMIRKLVQYLGADRSEMQDKILHTLAAVCSDHPSYDELTQLPYRHQQAFAGWISGVFLLPSLLTPGMNPSAAVPGVGR